MVFMILHPVVAGMPADLCVFVAMVVPVVLLPYPCNVVLPMLAIFFNVNAVVLSDRPALFQEKCQVLMMFLMGIIEWRVVVFVFGVYVPPGLYQTSCDLVVISNDGTMQCRFPTIISMLVHPFSVIPYTICIVFVERCEPNIVYV